MRKSKFVSVGVGLAAAALLVAGCSSSSSGSKPAGGATGATGTGDIPIGIVGSFSGTQASSEGGVPKVINAWVSAVNDAGGINGHHLKLFLKDDAGNPAASLTGVKELVEQDKVVAIVGETSNVDSTWQKYIEGKGVPVVGGLPLNTAFLTSPDFYSTGTNGIALQFGAVAAAKAQGDKFALLYCVESPQCKQGATLLGAIAPSMGVKVVLSTPVSATAPDYTAVCQQLKASGAQSYSIADGAAIVLRIAAACRQQGVAAKLVQIDGQVTAAYAENADVDGATGIEASFPFFDSSTPATKAYRDAIAKYAPTLGEQDGPISSYAWAAGKLFEAAVKSSGSAQVTASSIKTGLYALKAETLGGLTQPLTYTAGKPTALNCWFTIKLVDKAFTAPDGLKTSCAPDAAVAQIAAHLG